MDEVPQQRGYAFERFPKRWFDVWGLDAHTSFRTTGEQIDGSFQLDGATYLVEAKWNNKSTDANMLHGFQGKLLCATRALRAPGLSENSRFWKPENSGHLLKSPPQTPQNPGTPAPLSLKNA